MKRKKVILTGLVAAALIAISSTVVKEIKTTPIIPPGILNGSNYQKNLEWSKKFYAPKKTEEKKEQTQISEKAKDKEAMQKLEKENIENIKKVKRMIGESQEGKKEIYSAKFKQQAVSTVKDYINHLDAGDYRAAYNMLSAESKKKHGFDEFQKDCWYKNDWDLSTAKAEEREDGLAVIVSLSQDIAEHDFTVKKEGSQPKIIYKIGSPYWPY